MIQSDIGLYSKDAARFLVKFVEKLTEMKHYFLLGPSGVGKSTTAHWLAQNTDLLWIELDRWPEGEGLVIENLTREWEMFSQMNNAEPFSKSLDKRADERNRSGCVVSFPSGFIFRRSSMASSCKNWLRHSANVCKMLSGIVMAVG